MSYDLFLDDERYPAFDNKRNIIVCRTVLDFKQTITHQGFPVQLHLDHDLGEHGGGDGTDCMKWLLDQIIDCITNEMCPPDIEFFIHSQNPIGRERMQGYINDIMRLTDTCKSFT